MMAGGCWVAAWVHSGQQRHHDVRWEARGQVCDGHSLAAATAAAAVCLKNAPVLRGGPGTLGAASATQLLPALGSALLPQPAARGTHQQQQRQAAATAAAAAGSAFPVGSWRLAGCAPWHAQGVGLLRTPRGGGVQRSLPALRRARADTARGMLVSRSLRTSHCGSYGGGCGSASQQAHAAPGGDIGALARRS